MMRRPPKGHEYPVHDHAKQSDWIWKMFWCALTALVIASGIFYLGGLALNNIRSDAAQTARDQYSYFKDEKPLIMARLDAAEAEAAVNKAAVVALTQAMVEGEGKIEKRLVKMNQQQIRNTRVIETHGQLIAGIKLELSETPELGFRLRQEVDRQIKLSKFLKEKTPNYQKSIPIGAVQ